MTKELTLQCATRRGFCEICSFVSGAHSSEHTPANDVAHRHWSSFLNELLLFNQHSLCLIMERSITQLLCFDFTVEEAHAKTASFDSGDPLSTNLYVGNISPKVL